MTIRTSFKYNTTSASQLTSTTTVTPSTLLAVHLLEKFVRLPLWGAFLAAVLFWTAQQGGISFILSSGTTLSTLVIPLMPCVFAAIVPLVANPMYSLLYLLGVFFSTVLFYLSNGAEYLGLTLMIVYVGAVAVIFLFVLMLLNAKDQADMKDLLVYTTQYLAIFILTLFFGRIITHIYSPTEALIASREATSRVLEPTSGEAVEFFVRFQFSDISSIVPLYTQHGVSFVVLTTILLSALLGAIILATQTTERPVSAQSVCNFSTTRAGVFFLGVVLDLSLAEEFYLSVTTLLDSFGTLSVATVLGAPFFLRYKGFYPKLPSSQALSGTTAARYWR